VVEEMNPASPQPESWLNGNSVPGLSPEDGIAAIRGKDATFDPSNFHDRAEKAFMQLEQAWQDRNLDEGRAYMSPGLFLTWSGQVDQLIRLHKKNVMENLRILRHQVVKVVPGQEFDEITVRFDAASTDYEVDETSGKVVFGDKSEHPFVEYWTFQRSAGVKTIVQGGVVDKQCPNCGAPLNINQIGECSYCKAGVTSGKFDWVLSRIEQEEEWRG
jgi:predicted lipid-binding transport protein (Tim44 family)